MVVVWVQTPITPTRNSIPRPRTTRRFEQFAGALATLLLGSLLERSKQPFRALPVRWLFVPYILAVSLRPHHLLFGRQNSVQLTGKRTLDPAVTLLALLAEHVYTNQAILEFVDLHLRNLVFVFSLRIVSFASDS